MTFIGKLLGEREELINKLEDSILENDVIDEEIVKQLEIKEEELDDKLKANHYVIESKKGLIQTNKDIIESIKYDNERLNKVIDTIKQNTITALNLYGETGKSGNKKRKIPGLNVYTTNRSSINILDEDNLPDEYKDYTVSIKCDSDDYKKIMELINSHPDLSDTLPEVKVSSKPNKDKISNNLALHDEYNIIHDVAEEVQNTSVTFRTTKK